MNSRASRTRATPRTTRLQGPGGLRVTPKALAFAMFMALTPLAAPVDAAGLGRLNVQSALGQPLRAEVEVTSLSREDAQSLVAKLAGPEAFRQAGLEYNPALANLRFAIEPRGGRTFLRITSSQPINEPFVDMLLELNWASGKLLREYTFLLDPPEMRDGRVTTEAVQAVTPAIPPVASAPRPTRPAPTRAPTRATASGGAPSEGGSASTPGTVAVRRGDTLSGVAGAVRPEGVSLEQAMVSIYRANPSAFQRNINLLNEGARLTIPSREDMAAVSAAEAAREVRIQSADFSAYRRRLAGAAPAVDAPRSGQTASGTVTGRVEDKQAAPSGDRLRLSKPAGTEGGEGSAVGARNGAASRAEQKVARDAALKEANSRISDLEKNVDDLKKLLELRSRAMSDLQKQLDDAKAAQQAVTGQVGAVPPAPPVLPAPKADAPVVAAAKPGEAPGAVPPAAPPAAPATLPSAFDKPPVEPSLPEASKAVDATAGAEAPKPVEPPKVADASETPEPAKPATPAKPAAAKPAPEPVVSPPSLVDELLDNPLLLPALGGIAALGAGYGLYAMRRRRKVETFEDSLIGAEGLASNSLFGTTGGQSVDTSQSAYQSGITSSADVQATEVDPIAEADVYIAYGREAQAEDILREALARQPERQPIRYKLLQIYAARSDLDAFEAVAREMHQMTGGQGEDWEKAAALGLSIDPLHPLYGGPVVDESGVPAASVAMAGAGLAAAAASGGVATRTAAPAADDFDFPDLALDAQTRQQAPEPAAGPATLAAPVTAFDLDLGDSRLGPLDADAESPAMAGLPPLADAPVDSLAASSNAPVDTAPDDFAMPSLDFDLDIAPATRIAAAKALDELNQAVPPSANSSSALDSMDLDLDLDLPALETLSRMRVDPIEDGRESATAGSGLDTATVEADPPSAGDSASPRWQEMATKLDLASAYEEIGDKEGARELLREVVSGGDSTQQQKARAMLSKIG